MTLLDPHDDACNHGCPDHARAAGRVHSSRRRFLCLTTAGLVALPTALRSTVTLAAPRTSRRLVVVILRGGLDGLAAVPPIGDRFYRPARGELALDEATVLGLDDTFGLHPALRALHPYWAQGELAVIHAAALPYRDRSHFDAQNVLENGTERPGGAGDGWLNRALSLYGADGPPLGLAIGQAVPLILTGRAPVNSWTPDDRDADDQLLDQVARIYAQDPLFADAFRQARATQAETDAALQDVANAVQQARTGSARGQIERLVVPVARLLNQPDGARVAVIEMTGWDTHAAQGTDGGPLAKRLEALGDGLAALARELAPVWSETAVLVMTEFGRTVAINGTRGTDHGTGGVALALGGAIAGGSVHGRWPGLTQDRLLDGRDLMPTTDLRQVMASMLVDHLELPAGDVARHVLPGLGQAGALPGLIRRS